MGEGLSNQKLKHNEPGGCFPYAYCLVNFVKFIIFRSFPIEN